MLARITAAIARTKGDFCAVEMVESDGAQMVRDFTLTSGSGIQQRQIVQSLKRLAGVIIVQISDRVLQLHRGGKIEVHNKFLLDNGEVLAMAKRIRSQIAIQAFPSGATTRLATPV
jgi:malate dehydrogenase (oxaloacetate-decarboxylating)